MNPSARMTRIAGVTVALFFALSTATSSSAQTVPQHVVKKGDTLYSIARANQISVEALQRFNGIEGTIIHVGQKLWLSQPDTSLVATRETAQAPDPERDKADVTDVAADDPPLAAADGVTDELADADPEVDTEEPAKPARTLEDALSEPADAVDEADSAHLAHGVEQEEELEVADDAEETADEPSAPTVVVELDAAGLSAYDVHVAKEGETLYSIGQMYGVPVDSLWALNDEITDPLEVGARVRIPLDANVVLYTVESGDTLERVSRWFNVSVDELRRVNALESDKIVVGQQLRIPRTTGDVESPPTVAIPEETGIVKVYPQQYTGRLMASGKSYDPERFTVSHARLELGTVVLLTCPDTGGSTFAEVADRPPVKADYLMDISDSVAKALEIEGRTEATVRLRVVN